MTWEGRKTITFDDYLISGNYLNTCIPAPGIGKLLIVFSSWLLYGRSEKGRRSVAGYMSKKEYQFQVWVKVWGHPVQYNGLFYGDWINAQCRAASGDDRGALCRRIDTDVWTTQDNSSYHNNVKMRVDAWKNQGAKVFANCKAIVANSIFFSKLATMANGSWSPGIFLENNSHSITSETSIPVHPDLSAGQPGWAIIREVTPISEGCNLETLADRSMVTIIVE